MSEQNIQDISQNEMKYTPEEMKRRNKLRKKFLRRRRLLRVGTVLMIFFVIIYCVVGVFALNFAQELLADKPTLNVDDLIGDESSRIYDSNGDLVTEIGTYYRENITYDDCPEALVDAFLSIEDSRFFTHNGFDIPRFTMAAVQNVLNSDLGQGGSTFTMQLIKNSYFSVDAGDDSTERTKDYAYKAQQIWLSMELETKMDKKQIFELYVNKLNFGGRVRGVEKAAEYYFGKDACEMTLSECALLAGIVNLPNQYNPYSYLDYATDRRNEVLYLMLNHGYITEEEYNLAKSIKIEDQLVGEEKLNVENDQYAEYVDAVIDEVVDKTGNDPVLVGMDIYTALIPEIQDTIEEIESGESGIPWTDDLMQTAIVSMNNQTGEIVGIGGGRNYGESGGSRLLNRATSQYKQPGSSIKPVLDYALGFEYLGYSLDELVMDQPITFPSESRVLKNADGNYHGQLTMKDAVASSYNIPAILTLQDATTKAGIQTVVDYMHAIGFTVGSVEEFHLSYAIGGNNFETTVKELAGAHATMLNLGVYNEPHTITKIVFTKDGSEYLPENQGIRALSSGSAYLVCQLMNYNVTSNRGYYYGIIQRSYPVYAKTGTTDWGDSGLAYGIPEGAAKDSWMVSSTSQYTNSVWLGYDKAVAGAGTYMAAWKQYLNITGRINSQLLDIEADVSPDTIGGVQMPSDVQTVTYVYGSWPHVEYAGQGTAITSLVSSTGLSNMPTQSASRYGNGRPVLTEMNATISETGLLYLDWVSNTTCNSDMSLHDTWNNESFYGSCLASNYFIGGWNNTYVADIYQNGEYVGSVSSDKRRYTGFPVRFEGDISVCGYYYNNVGTSETQCTSAGYFSYDEHGY